MPNQSPSNADSLKLQLLTARKEWRPTTADSSPQAVTCQLVVTQLLVANFNSGKFFH